MPMIQTTGLINNSIWWTLSLLGVHVGAKLGQRDPEFGKVFLRC